MEDIHNIMDNQPGVACLEIVFIDVVPHSSSEEQSKIQKWGNSKGEYMEYSASVGKYMTCRLIQGKIDNKVYSRKVLTPNLP